MTLASWRSKRIKVSIIKISINDQAPVSEQLGKMSNNRISIKSRRAVVVERTAEHDEVLSTGEGMLLLSALSAVIVSVLSFAFF